MSKQEPQMPWGKYLISDALPWITSRMAEHGEYHTDHLKEYLTELHRDAVDPDLPMPNGNRSLWANYIDWLTAYMTGERLHLRLNPKVYRLTPLGEALATGLADGSITDPIEWVAHNSVKPPRVRKPKDAGIGDREAHALH
jgi:hypothetical protein